MEVVKRLMLNKMPLVPDAAIAACDVRDVAAAHINALVTRKKTTKKQHLLISIINISLHKRPHLMRKTTDTSYRAQKMRCRFSTWRKYFTMSLHLNTTRLQQLELLISS